MPLQRATILVVDDEPISSMIISEALSCHGCTPVVVNRSRKALFAIKNNMPDLILLDVYMPGLNGIELCRMIKQEPGCESIPVIFLSASDTDIELAMEVGGVDYILKPFDIQDLVARALKQLKQVS